MKKMKLDIQRFSIPYTYFEFEDLPSTETPLNAQNLNQMQNTIHEEMQEDIKKGISTTYSEEEVKTNETWINGKPIYRKVGKITFTSKNTFQRGSFISNDIDYGTISEIYIYSPLSTSLYNTKDSTVTSNLYVENGSSSGDKGYLMGFTSRDDFLNKTIYAVVKYTKKTD